MLSAVAPVPGVGDGARLTPPSTGGFEWSKQHPFVWKGVHGQTWAVVDTCLTLWVSSPSLFAATQRENSANHLFKSATPLGSRRRDPLTAHGRRAHRPATAAPAPRWLHRGPGRREPGQPGTARASATTAPWALAGDKPTMRTTHLLTLASFQSGSLRGTCHPWCGLLRTCLEYDIRPSEHPFLNTVTLQNVEEFFCEQNP
jgi:hypothetical protein